MDSQRFDHLARRFATGVSRRSLLGTVAAGVAGGLLGRGMRPNQAAAQVDLDLGPLLCLGLGPDVALATCLALPNVADAACDQGRCVIRACFDGWADCDGDATNGCETELGTPEHCGACGDVCAGDVCEAGACAGGGNQGLTPPSCDPPNHACGRGGAHCCPPEATCVHDGGSFYHCQCPRYFDIRDGQCVFVGPVAGDDFAETEQDTPVTIDVLVNDTAEGSLHITSASAAGNGAVRIGTDGTITYTPNAGFTGEDSFYYLVANEDGDSDRGTVTVAVTAPTCLPDDATCVLDNQCCSGLCAVEDSGSNHKVCSHKQCLPYSYLCSTSEECCSGDCRPDSYGIAYCHQ